MFSETLTAKTDVAGSTDRYQRKWTPSFMGLGKVKATPQPQVRLSGTHRPSETPHL